MLFKTPFEAICKFFCTIKTKNYGKENNQEEGKEEFLGKEIRRVPQDCRQKNTGSDAASTETQGIQ